MVKDAEAHAAEDKNRRDRIEKHNQLDTMIYQAEKMLADNAENLGDADKQALQSAIDDGKKDLESDDAARFDAGRQRLEAALHKVAETLYKSGATGAADAAEGAAEAKAEEDVIDAEYTEEKGDS